MKKFFYRINILLTLVVLTLTGILLFMSQKLIYSCCVHVTLTMSLLFMLLILFTDYQKSPTDFPAVLFSTAFALTRTHFDLLIE